MNNQSKFQRHRKEILSALATHGSRQEDGNLIVNRLDIGFSGFQKVEVFAADSVIRACLANDPEWEAAERALVAKAKLAGREVLMSKIQETSGANTWFAEGITQALNVFLGDTAKQASHYFLFGTINTAPLTTWVLDPGGSVPIGASFGDFTGYDEAARPTWVNSAAASNSITNPTASSITCAAGSSGTLYGACMVSKNAKDGTADASGYGVAGKLFGASVPVNPTNVINVTHTLSGSAI